jgi:kynureninase
VRADRAAALDSADILASFRDRFLLPDGTVYLDGNSLGALPVDTPPAIAETLDTWRRRAVLGWDDWIDAGARLGDALAPLIGAPAGSVAISDQTSINLFKLASAALEHTGRPSILTDAGNFPSDRYILEAVAARAGGRLVVAPEDADPDTLEGILNAGAGDEVGLVALTHVAYRSGHLHDGRRVTRMAHDAGTLILWDLAHSAGAVPVDLASWGADLAVGCTYKYLNGGPGSPGYLFVRPGLIERIDQPIHGWFGHEDMFGFVDDYAPARSIRRFLVGTPPIVALAATEVGIEITAEAGIERIHAKGMSLGTLFVDFVEPVLHDGGGALASPRDPRERGSHVSVAHPDAYAISRAMREAGIVVDFRAPDILRFGFAPLYVRHQDIAHAVDVLDDVLRNRVHRSFPADPTGVT